MEPDIVARTVASACFEIEATYLKRGGIEVAVQPRLYKHIDDRFVRLIFPTTVTEVDDGTVVGLVCLWDRQAGCNVYAHCIAAGPGVNAQLRAVHSPLNQVKPQPGTLGDAAVAKFVAWKQAAWGKFLNDELDCGTAEASARWIECFWNALGRMYGVQRVT